MSPDKKWLRRARSFAGLALVYFGTVMASLAQNESPSAVTPTAGQNKIDKVIVTARKREESLQDVALSVVAVSEQELERRSIKTLADLGQSTPNFDFSQTYNGGSTAGVAFIRGVGQRDSHSAYDPAVGIYIDGVYFGRMYGNNLDMMESEQVEVLRGPQGTLFGKNTSGGAINITTKVPDASADGFSGRALVTTGSRNRFDLVGGLNFPLVDDTLALRIAGSRNRQDGYGHRADGQDMANTERESARAQLLFKPTQRFAALVSADWMQFDEANASYKLLATNTSVGPVAAYNAARDPDYNNSWVSPRDYFSLKTATSGSSSLPIVCRSSIRIARTSRTSTKHFSPPILNGCSGQRLATRAYGRRHARCRPPRRFV